MCVCVCNVLILDQILIRNIHMRISHIIQSNSTIYICVAHSIAYQKTYVTKIIIIKRNEILNYSRAVSIAEI